MKKIFFSLNIVFLITTPFSIKSTEYLPACPTYQFICYQESNQEFTKLLYSYLIEFQKIAKNLEIDQYEEFNGSLGPFLFEIFSSNVVSVIISLESSFFSNNFLRNETLNKKYFMDAVFSRYAEKLLCSFEKLQKIEQETEIKNLIQSWNENLIKIKFAAPKPRVINDPFVTPKDFAPKDDE